MTALVAAAGDPGVDAGRAVVVALAHDAAEAIVGDLAPGDAPKADKAAREAEAMASMADMLGGEGSAAATLVAGAWAEYEAGATPEARLVKDCDKVEMLLQAAEYEGEHPGLDLGEFFASVEGRLTTRAGKALASEVALRRPARRGP